MRGLSQTAMYALAGWEMLRCRRGLFICGPPFCRVFVLEDTALAVEVASPPASFSALSVPSFFSRTVTVQCRIVLYPLSPMNSRYQTLCSDIALVTLSTPSPVVSWKDSFTALWKEPLAKLLARLGAVRQKRQTLASCQLSTQIWPLQG